MFAQVQFALDQHGPRSSSGKGEERKRRGGIAKAKKEKKKQETISVRPSIGPLDPLDTKWSMQRIGLHRRLPNIILLRGRPKIIQNCSYTLRTLWMEAIRWNVLLGEGLGAVD